MISDLWYRNEHVNAARQRRNPNSMLNWTERIIRMRKQVPEVGWGDFEMIATRADGRGKHRLLLEAFGYRWYRVGGLDYLLKRSDVAA